MGITKSRIPTAEDIKDPESITAYFYRYLEWMRIKNYSKNTIELKRKCLSHFLDWSEQRTLQRPNEITKPILERYQRYLYHYRKTDGEPLSFKTQSGYLSSVRNYFRWLAKQNYILYNPASEIELPRLQKRLPKHVLTQEEAEIILSVPDIDTEIGIRDRAMLEVLYSTGIRRMEIINLNLYDIDTSRGTIMVRLGKGQKDRMVPIGARAIAWIEKYIQEVRPEYLKHVSDQTLFLSTTGAAISTSRLTQLVRRYVKKADIGKTGSCHLFRHTMATLMLENGADIRYIQEMLGHTCVDTTQIYTQVSIRKLKEIHNLTHPAKLKDQKKQEVEEVTKPTKKRSKEPKRKKERNINEKRLHN